MPFSPSPPPPTILFLSVPVLLLGDLFLVTLSLFILWSSYVAWFVDTNVSEKYIVSVIRVKIYLLSNSLS
jgi:hypothetical protein